MKAYRENTHNSQPNQELITVGPVLIAWFNYCVSSFASELVNLLIAFASHEAHEYAINRIQLRLQQLRTQ